MDNKAINSDNYKKAKTILKDTFGHDEFKEFQYRIIDNHFIFFYSGCKNKLVIFLQMVLGSALFLLLNTTTINFSSGKTLI